MDLSEYNELLGDVVAAQLRASDARSNLIAAQAEYQSADTALREAWTAFRACQDQHVAAALRARGASDNG